MADYNATDEFIGGKWAKASELGHVKRAKITTEVKPSPSQFKDKDGNAQMQDVGKVQFEGVKEELNVRLNRATISGLVKAFGSDSKLWVGKVLNVVTEKMRVAGKQVTALYLIPSGYELTNDAEGYAKIQKIGVETEQPAPADDIPTIQEGEDVEEFQITDVPF